MQVINTRCRWTAWYPEEPWWPFFDCGTEEVQHIMEIYGDSLLPHFSKVDKTSNLLKLALFLYPADLVVTPKMEIFPSFWVCFSVSPLPERSIFNFFAATCAFQPLLRTIKGFSNCNYPLGRWKRTVRYPLNVLISRLNPHSFSYTMSFHVSGSSYIILSPLKHLSDPPPDFIQFVYQSCTGSLEVQVRFEMWPHKCIK